MRISTKTIAIIALAVLVSIALVGTSFLAGFGMGWFVLPARQPTPVARGPEEFELFWEAWEIVERQFYGELPGPQEFTHDAIRGALSSLDDPATILVKPKAAEDQMIELKGTYEGIGALVGVDKQERIVIVAPFDGSPAIQAGIMAGDVILKVDDTMVTGMPLEDVVRLIRGPRGTKVQLTILREGEPESLVFEIIRDRVELVTVAWRVIDAIGYVRIALFSERTSGELEKALRELRQEEIEGLILDLRNNPGGVFPSAAIEVASQFLEGGIIVYERDKDGREKPYSVKGGGFVMDIPLVVLVN
ncbi:MAG: S41 family peptidase, partial [Candidatus Tectimicrobiota bacterium]